MPDASLRAAIATFWHAQGLDASVAPLFSDGPWPGTALPYLVIDRVDEVVPGPSADTTPVEMYLTAHASSAAAARALAKSFLAAIVPDPVAGSTRSPLSWTGGVELFAERDDAFPDRNPKRQAGGRWAYRYRVHLTWWISGSA